MGGTRVRAFPLFLALLCTTGPALAVTPFREDCKLERRATLPFTLDHHHINVPVAVNGHSFSFVLDTGGVFSAINARAAKAADLTPVALSSGLRIRDAGGKDTTAVARIKTITFGTLKSDNLTLMITNLSGDGVLAPDLLRNFDLDLDFDARQINLFKPHRCDDQVVYWTDEYAVIPFILTEQGHIRIDVAVNGVPLKAMLDTGSPTTLIGEDTLQAKLGLTADAAHASAMVGISGGVLGTAPVKLDSLQIGKFLWPNPPVFASTRDIWKADASDMLLGLNEIGGLHVYIDYRGRKLYLSRRQAPAER